VPAAVLPVPSRHLQQLDTHILMQPPQKDNPVPCPYPGPAPVRPAASPRGMPAPRPRTFRLRPKP
jgi:hypothetical protein